MARVGVRIAGRAIRALRTTVNCIRKLFELGGGGEYVLVMMAIRFCRGRLRKRIGYAGSVRRV